MGRILGCTGCVLSAIPAGVGVVIGVVARKLGLLTFAPTWVLVTICLGLSVMMIRAARKRFHD